MADTIDDAQAYNEVYQRASLQNFRDKLEPESHPDFDGKRCVDCGENMPKARLVLSRIRCRDCQEDVEARERQFKR